MSPRCWAFLVLAVVTLSAFPCPGAEAPKSSAVLGKPLFQSLCSYCHGDTGHGNGVHASALSTPPSDLTSLSARTRGRFPELYVESAIDGEQFSYRELSPEMPSWGPVFRGTLGEAEAQTKIESLTKYIKTLQIPRPSLRHTHVTSSAVSHR